MDWLWDIVFGYWHYIDVFTNIKMRVLSSSSLTAGLLAFSSTAMSKRIVVGGRTLSVFNFDTNSNTLTLLGTNNNLDPTPSWQQYTRDGKFLLSSGEGNWGQLQSGKVGVYKVDGTGMIGNAVSTASAFYGTVSITDDGKGNVYAAAYDSSGISQYTLSESGQLTAVKQTQFTIPQIGPNRGRQEKSHPHQVLLDPTGKFLFVPDLGGDVTRIFTLPGGQLNSVANLTSAPGSGPRHGIFWPNGNDVQPTNFYLIHELSNTVVAHNVTYGNMTIDVKPTQTLSTYGDKTAPAVFPTPTAAEMAISPDGKFLYASNRSDKSLNNGQSDSIAVYSRDAEGRLTFLRLEQAGGVGPRHFSLDSTGEYLVSGLGNNNRIVVFRRNSADGSLTKVAEASAQIPACVTFLD